MRIRINHHLSCQDVALPAPASKVLFQTLATNPLSDTRDVTCRFVLDPGNDVWFKDGEGHLAKSVDVPKRVSGNSDLSFTLEFAYGVGAKHVGPDDSLLIREVIKCLPDPDLADNILLLVE